MAHFMHTLRENTVGVYSLTFRFWYLFFSDTVFELFSNALNYEEKVGRMSSEPMIGRS